MKKREKLGHFTEMSNDLKVKIFDEFTQVFMEYESIIDLTPKPFVTNNNNPLWDGYESPVKINEWFYVLDDLETICKKYFTIKELDNIDLNTKRVERFNGGAILLNDKFTKSLQRFVKIELDSIYTNYIYKMIYKKELFFTNRYLEFIFPLVMDLRKQLKIEKSSNLDGDYPQTLIGIFINYIFGIMSSVKTTEVESNIGVDDIVNYYRNILNNIFEKSKNIIYIDTDMILVSTKHKSDILYITNILEDRDIAYELEDIGDIGMFVAKKKYLQFDKDMNIKKCKGMRING